MREAQVTHGWRRPAAVWMLMLVVIFVVEYAVMLVLPLILPHQTPRMLESIVDAVLLTSLLAPVLWWTLVRPLREVIRLRTQFLTDLFAQIELERRRTASELHDGVGQSLTLLVSGLRSATVCRATADCDQRVTELQRVAHEALNEVRRLAMGLRPSLLDDLGLTPALERLVEDVRSHHELTIALDVDGIREVILPEQVATAIFRITQEALTNIIKHSQASQAHITVRPGVEEAGLVSVEIRDDGCGMDAQRLATLPGMHLGLRGMRERVALLGGSFSIESAPAQGTRIIATIPLGESPHG